MSIELAANDFISRVRQRHQVAVPKAPEQRRIYIVHVSRDGHTTEDLIFDKAPNIGAIAARVGTEAFVISTDVIHPPKDEHIAAE